MPGGEQEVHTIGHEDVGVQLAFGFSQGFAQSVRSHNS